MNTASVNRRAEERIHNGHPWIYRSDVTAVAASAGDLVAVKAANGRVLGHAMFSDQSLITLRMISRGAEPPAATWLRDRIKAAIDWRGVLGIDATAYRLVHGEGDLLPSLIVDRYDDVLVMQALSQGMPFENTSTSIRWLSVPPLTSRKPASARFFARRCALATICFW